MKPLHMRHCIIYCTSYPPSLTVAEGVLLRRCGKWRGGLDPPEFTIFPFSKREKEKRNPYYQPVAMTGFFSPFPM